MPQGQAVKLPGLNPWKLVVLLTAIQIVSYVDRFLPSLLVQPIKASLSLTDFQVGLILGPAFAIFYVFVGLPLGWLADHVSRTKLLASGILIWCAMTTCASLAMSFWPLFLTRLGVGLGEATVAPCAVSLISDSFSRKARARAMSVFMSGAFLGAGTAFLAGGPLVHWLASLPPPIEGMLPWQTAFLTIGPMGVVLAIILSFMREPVRSDIIAREAGGPSTTLAAAVAYVAPRWRAFGTLFVGSGCVVTMGSLTLWNVALFQRIWQWNVAEVGIATGVLYFCGGGFGTILGVFLTQRWQKAGQSAVTLRVLWTGLAIGVPGFALFPLMPDVRLALAGLFLAFTGQAMATAAGPASLSLLAPGQIRAQATAIYYLIIGVAGQVLGPPPVGWMADLFGDPKGLRYAVSIEAIAVGLPTLLLVYLGTKAFARAEQALEAQVAS